MAMADGLLILMCETKVVMLLHETLNNCSCVTFRTQVAWWIKNDGPNFAHAAVGFENRPHKFFTARAWHIGLQIASVEPFLAFPSGDALRCVRLTAWLSPYKVH
jgi:hypothetical protein